MKALFIKDISKGEVLSDFLGGISKIEELKDKNGKLYYDLEVIDSTGILKGKIWSDKLDRIESSALQSGKVIRLSGVVSEFRGELQLVIHEAFEVEESDYTIDDYIQSVPRDIEELWKIVNAKVEKLLNKEIYDLLKTCLTKYELKLKSSPAAERLHHAYRGGLLEHIVEMFGLMETTKEFYPQADYEIITAGIILHDIGKTRELSVDGFSTVRTDEGKLIGHLILSLEIFLELIPKDFDPKLKMKIEHLILSHHGILEYGSPVVPKTIEAIILHKIDDLSSNVRQFKRVIDENEGSTSFSKKDWALGTEVYLQ